MPVPKHKKSKAKSKMRRIQYNKIALPTLIQCYCEKKLMIPSHKICPYCGIFKDRTIIDVKSDDHKKEIRKKRKESE